MLIRLILALLTFGTLVSPVWAANTILSVGLQTSYMFPYRDSAGGKVESDGGILYGANFTYGYPDRGVTLSIERITMNLDGVTLDGEYTMTPVILTGYWRLYKRGRRIIPLMGIGLGVFISHFEDSNKAKSLGIDSTVSDPVGLQALIGFEYLMTDNISLLFYARYLFAKMDVSTVKIVDGEGKTSNHRVTLNTYITGFGIRKYF